MENMAGVRSRSPHRTTHDLRLRAGPSGSSGTGKQPRMECREGRFPLKIAHVITGLNTGGAETMLYKLLSRMDRAKFDPLVVSLADNGSLAARIAALNIPVFSCGMQPGFPSLGAAFRLTRLLRGFAPHLLQGWMYHGNLAAQAAAVGLAGKTPVVWNIRGSHHLLSEEKFMTAATIWIGARLSALPSKIVANSAVSA